MKFISNTSDNSPEFLNFAWNMSQKKHITFIINPISGGHEKEDIVELIKNDLDTTLFDAEIRMTEYAGHAMEIARECVKKEWTSWLPSVATGRSMRWHAL